MRAIAPLQASIHPDHHARGLAKSSGMLAVWLRHRGRRAVRIAEKERSFFPPVTMRSSGRALLLSEALVATTR